MKLLMPRCQGNLGQNTTHRTALTGREHFNLRTKRSNNLMELRVGLEQTNYFVRK